MSWAFDDARRRLEDAIVSEVHNRLVAKWKRVDQPKHAVAVVQQVVREVLACEQEKMVPRVLCLVSLEGGGVRLRARVQETKRAARSKAGRVVPMRTKT